MPWGLTTSGELVVNLLFKEKHFLSSKLIQYAGRAFTTQKTVEARMGVGEVLRAAQDTLSFPINLLIRHPWDIGGAR
jgi:hypothetical protein